MPTAGTLSHFENSRLDTSLRSIGAREEPHTKFNDRIDLSQSTQTLDSPGRRETAGCQCSPSCTTSHSHPVAAQRTTAASAATAITMDDNAKVWRSGRWAGARTFSGITGSSAWERPVPVGCSLAGLGNWRGENHDENSTDWRCGRLTAGRGHDCHGSKWSAHWRIPTSAVEPKSLWPLRLPSSLLRPPSSLLRLLSSLPPSSALVNSSTDQGAGKRRAGNTMLRG